MQTVENIFEERKESDFHATPDGEKAVSLLYNYKSDPKVSSENINNVYNEMGSQGYDEWAEVVNFTEPFEIVKQVGNSKEEECLEMDTESKLLDVGAGTGIIAR